MDILQYDNDMMNDINNNGSMIIGCPSGCTQNYVIGSLPQTIAVDIGCWTIMTSIAACIYHYHLPPIISRRSHRCYLSSYVAVL